MIDEALLRELLQDLVKIDSVNPSLAPGAKGEAAAAEFLREFLRRQGIEARLQEAAPGRPNVVAVLGGDPRSTKPQRAALAILAHMDTVGGGDMPEPFVPRERNGRLYGRGALDIKSGVAAMCAAGVSVVREGAGLERPILLAAVVDEECNSIGTEKLLEEYSANAAVVLEPTDLKIVVAHKGYAWFEITTHGRAAHGSLPSEGRDAIRAMGRVLVALEDLEKTIEKRPPHRRLGHASLHASVISGGQELSSYPAECRLQLERRTIPGETQQSVTRELEDLLARLQAADGGFRSSLQFLSGRPPYEISEELPLVRSAIAAVKRVTATAEVFGMAAWTDTALLAGAGIPGVVFGPRGRGLHGAEEYVELDSVVICAQVLHELILTFTSSRV